MGTKAPFEVRNSGELDRAGLSDRADWVGKAKLSRGKLLPRPAVSSGDEPAQIYIFCVRKLSVNLFLNSHIEINRWLIKKGMNHLPTKATVRNIKKIPKFTKLLQQT